MSSLDAYDFFLSYLAAFVVIGLYIIGYAWKREGWVRLDQIDLDSGRRMPDPELHRQITEEKKTWSVWKRFYKRLF